jgi:hypothetical protein
MGARTRAVALGVLGLGAWGVGLAANDQPVPPPFIISISTQSIRKRR